MPLNNNYSEDGYWMDMNKDQFNKSLADSNLTIMNKHNELQNNKPSLTSNEHIKFWKPNLFQRFAYWLGIVKDPRYDGKDVNHINTMKSGN